LQQARQIKILTLGGSLRFQIILQCHATRCCNILKAMRFQIILQYCHYTSYTYTILFKLSSGSIRQYWIIQRSVEDSISCTTTNFKLRKWKIKISFL